MDDSNISFTNTDNISLGPIATINDLLQVRDVLVKKESDDILLFNSVFQPDDTILKNALIQWATIGFPHQYVLLSVQMNPPPTCSDGQIRNFYFYSLYLAKLEDMSSLLSTLNIRVAGMIFDFTLTDTNTLNLIVSKA